MVYQIKQREFPKKLWNLIDMALRGEPVFIERDDKAVVQLVPLKQMLRSRKAGSAKGMIQMADDFDAPLGDFAEYTSLPAPRSPIAARISPTGVLRENPPYTEKI